ncbi:hypothetical protein J3F83DRAFT_733541, partial [Trichoderma novae-zelandiae]
MPIHKTHPSTTYTYAHCTYIGTAGTYLGLSTYWAIFVVFGVPFFALFLVCCLPLPPLLLPSSSL